MRVLVQRVQRAQVSVEDVVVGSIDRGLLLLVGIGPEDGDAEIDWMADKVAGLRVFPSPTSKAGGMDASLLDVGGGALVVSQFTLYGDVQRGKRPSFSGAAAGPVASSRVDQFAEAIRTRGVTRVETGRFGAMMQVELVNDGPVTIWIEREPKKDA